MSLWWSKLSLRGLNHFTHPNPSIILVHGLGGHPRTTWIYGKDWIDSPNMNNVDESIIPSEPSFIRGRSLRSLISSLVWKPSVEPYSDHHQSSGASLQTSKPPSVFWPTDFLQDDLPRSRILTWGYDSNIVGFTDAISQNTVYIHATNLVADLGYDSERLLWVGIPRCDKSS